VVDFGRAQQRLGRNAPPVRADAAEKRALDDRGLEAELRRADGGDVAAGTRANDDDIEGIVWHGYFLLTRAVRFQRIKRSFDEFLGHSSDTSECHPD
jgi:hypothetical protein